MLHSLQLISLPCVLVQHLGSHVPLHLQIVLQLCLDFLILQLILLLDHILAYLGGVTVIHYLESVIIDHQQLSFRCCEAFLGRCISSKVTLSLFPSFVTWLWSCSCSSCSFAISTIWRGAGFGIGHCYFKLFNLTIFNLID